MSEPEQPKQPIAPPVDVPPTSPAPAQESAPEGSASPASSPLDDLLGAMNEEGVSHEQMIAFAGKKGVLKEGTDKDLAVMSDILPSKIPILAKMVRAKGTALKEMKG